MMMMMMMMMMSTLYSNRECAFVHVRVVDQSISMLILTLWHLVCSLLLVNFPLWNQLEAGPPGIPGREFPGIRHPNNPRREFPGITEFLAKICGNFESL